MIAVTFDDIGPPLEQNLKMKCSFVILDSVYLDHASTLQSAQYSYDQNQIVEYPTYNKKFPWKFGLKNSVEYVKPKVPFSASRKRKENHNTLLNWRTATNNDDHAFEYDQVKVGVSNIDSLAMTYTKALACADTVFQFSSKVMDTLVVVLYTTCESDDDFEKYCVNKDPNDPPYSSDADYDGSLQADCVTPINAEFECIDRGKDGRLDLLLDVYPAGSPADFWRSKE